MPHVITKAEAEYALDQEEVRRIVATHKIDVVLMWILALKLGLPMQPYHAPSPGTIGAPNRG